MDAGRADKRTLERNPASIAWKVRRARQRSVGMSPTTIALDQVARGSDEAQVLVDTERLRIARELHDVVAFSFATISVQAGVAVHVADDRPEVAAEALRAIKAISGDASRELRAILGMLRRTAGAGDAPVQRLAGLNTLAS